MKGDFDKDTMQAIDELEVKKAKWVQINKPDYKPLGRPAFGVVYSMGAAGEFFFIFITST